MIDQAVNVLHLFSNSRHFQIGWVTDSEINHLKSNLKDAKKASIESGKKNIEDEIEEELSELENSKNKFLGSNFEGIVKSLRNKNIIPARDPRGAYNQLLDVIFDYQKQHNPNNELFIDYIWNEFGEHTGESFARNGFRWRVRKIGQLVLNWMNNKQEQIAKILIVGGGENKDGEEGMDSIDNAASPEERSARMANAQKAFEILRRKGKYISPEELNAVGNQTNVPPAELKKYLDMLGIQGTTIDPYSAKAKLPRQGVAPRGRRKTIADPFGDDDDIENFLKSNNSDYEHEEYQDPFGDDDDVEEFLKNNKLEFNQNEMAGTYAVSPKKPRDGCGYNIWGAAGRPAVLIKGEADTASTDPVGKKGLKNARGTTTPKRK